MCMIPEQDTKLFKSLVDNLVQLDWVTIKEADGIYAEYKRYRVHGCKSSQLAKLAVDKELIVQKEKTKKLLMQGREKLRL